MIKQPTIVVTLRMPSRLKGELQKAAVAAGRTLSDEMRFRLKAGADERILRVALSALKAKIPHEQIERLIAEFR